MPMPNQCPDPECQAAAQRSLASNAERGHGAGSAVVEASSRRGSRDGATSPTTVYNPYYTGRPKSPPTASKHAPIDRQEIIRKIKSRENGSRPTSPELERPSSATGRTKRTSPLLQSREDGGDARPLSTDRLTDNQTNGLQIERPRSALHRGDFREKEERESGLGRFAEVNREEQTPALSTSPVAPWHPGFPAAAFRQAWLERRQPPPPQPSTALQRPPRSRAVSNASLSHSFTYQPPTSPLVQSSRPDTPDPPTRHSSRSPDKSRRHTFSPDALKRYSSALEYPASARGKPTPTLRKETTYPYQAHQPRRSLHSFNSLPHTPSTGSRRPSFSESPLQAPMVGSYEESILRGRMSSTPSKPLNFVAQIGVLGRGQCSSKLRCPPHAIVPFPAVFYSYGSQQKTETASDSPSPYVGLVDLENSLPSAESSPEKRRQRLEERLQAALSDEGSRASSQTREDGSTSDVHARRRRRQKQKRRSGSPKAPPGGSYRIPQQGQLQIVIKNPNKTAVKLFLIPYDLSDMEPGQKTFIRQRSYSAGPVIDMPMTSRKNLGTDRPEAALSTSDDPNERPMLRYLIHLHICCPSKGRFFLYKSVRVVFANRVPDGKERLRNEIQLPEPRYSAYKPGRDSNVGIASGSASSQHRRRGSAVDLVTPTPGSPDWRHARRCLAHSLPTHEHNSNAYPYAQDFQFPSAMPTLESRPASRQAFGSDYMDIDSQRSMDTRSTLSPISPTSMLSPVLSTDERGPLDENVDADEPFVFERDSVSEGRERERESLLSRRLRGLAFQGQQQGQM